jgi:hypothetical protein
VEAESVAVHEEVPKEEAAVKTVRALKERYGDRHLAVERRQQLKKWDQGDGASRKKMAAACRRMTRRSGTLRRKGCSHKEPTLEKRQRKERARENVARGTSKGWIFWTRCPACPKCNNSVRN